MINSARALLGMSTGGIGPLRLSPCGYSSRFPLPLPPAPAARDGALREHIPARYNQDARIVGQSLSRRGSDPASWCRVLVFPQLALRLAKPTWCSLVQAFRFPSAGLARQFQRLPSRGGARNPDRAGRGLGIAGEKN
jgi:hypothetical protein